MKTYLLRAAKTVEPQSARRAPRTRPVPTPTTASEVLGQPVPPPNGPALFIGLDVHTDSIAVSLAPAGSTEVRRYGMIGGTHDDVLRLARKLQATHPCNLQPETWNLKLGTSNQQRLAGPPTTPRREPHR
jgi:hypothetical protein